MNILKKDQIITLYTFKDILDNTSEYLKRVAKNQSYSLDYLLGIAEGVYKVLVDLLPGIQYPELIKTINNLDTDLIGYVEVFDKSYSIYMDDYGQCFYTIIDDKEYSFGTYNTDIVPELVSLVLIKYIEILSNEIKEIYYGKI